MNIWCCIFCMWQWRDKSIADSCDEIIALIQAWMLLVHGLSVVNDKQSWCLVQPHNVKVMVCTYYISNVAAVNTTCWCMLPVFNYMLWLLSMWENPPTYSAMIAVAWYTMKMVATFCKSAVFACGLLGPLICKLSRWGMAESMTWTFSAASRSNCHSTGLS